MTYDTPVPLDTDTVPCRRNPEKQFPKSNGAAREAQEHAAKTVCRRGNNGKPCHLFDACFAYAMEYAVEGVWGASTWAERQKIRAANGVVPISITPGTARVTVYRRTA